MQEQTPSSKRWTQLASLTMIALPTIFEMNFVEVWQSSQTHRFFLNWRGIPAIVLMSPNAIASFSLWWPKWNNYSSSSTSCKIIFLQGTYPHINLDNLCSFKWISIIWGGLDPLLQVYAPHYSLQPRCNLPTSSHLFPLSTIQQSQIDAYYQQQHKSLTTTHNQQHYQAPFQEFVWQHILPTPHYHEFCKH